MTTNNDDDDDDGDVTTIGKNVIIIIMIKRFKEIKLNKNKQTWVLDLAQWSPTWMDVRAKFQFSIMYAGRKIFSFFN